jgi:hypothetical protein
MRGADQTLIGNEEQLMAEGEGNGSGWPNKLGPILTGIGLAGLLAGYVLNNLQSQITYLTDHTISKGEFKEAKERFDVQLGDAMARVRRLEDATVPRSEHQTHWTEEDSRISALSVRINELQHEVSGAYTLGDTIKHLEAEIQALSHPALQPKGP